MRNSAIEEIRNLLAARERLYNRAGVTIDTSSKNVRQSLAELRKKAIS